jgi:hypothetical protein
MSILKDGVKTSTSYHGLRMFKYACISYDHKMLLKSITRRQRSKFKKYKLIPSQVLQFFWDRGYLPGEERPNEGMRLKEFLKFLQKGQYRDETNRARGIWLHDKIEQEEFPDKDLRYDMLVGVEGTKLSLVSNLRKQPGTIFR